MTVQSLKTIGQSNLDLEHTQLSFKNRWWLSRKQDGRPKNFFFQKLSPLTLKRHRKPEDDNLNQFTVLGKSRK